MSQRLAIDCRQVSKRFVLDSTFTLWQLLRANGNTPCYQALSDIDLTVPAGEFVGLLGRNGAGKSTLLRTIGGIHYPDHGTIHINGELSGLYELGIGGNDHLDGAAFARRWFGLIGTAGRSMVDLLDEVREFSELGEAFRRPIRTYSSGMRARLFFAVATALAAQVYVIDEMLSVGDEYFQNKCWRRLRERLGRGASGLLATHDWTAILKLCPTCYILDHGRVIASGPSPTVVREYLGNTADTLSTGAKFAPDLPLRFTAASLAEFEAPIEIDVTAPGEVQFGASVERFLPGYGWEHVLHSAPQTVATAQGRHRIALTVPRLPLPAATYSLGLFLVLLTPDGTRLMTDIRSWTYGNALELEVTGAKSRGAVRIPMSMRIVEELEVAS